MIITENQPEILWNLYHIYKKANKNGKAFNTIKKCLFHNNEPINVLVAITALKDVECMIEIGRCHPVEFEYCLRYLSQVTGYSPIELQDMLEM